ncbi:hypothetical protein EQ500_14430, partial [Lactobacillus sp. XV13L]|nr:hypothetical protein [Lactobacillus sp. XV13L]
MEQLQKKLNSLLEHIQKNQTDFDNIATKAPKLGAKLQSNAAHYQKAFEPLRTQLTALTKDLSDISTLVTSGDALKAHQLLEDKQVQLSKFQTKAEQILERSINLETDFKTELQELQTAEQRLKVSGINLENPQIATELVEITQKIN